MSQFLIRARARQRYLMTPNGSSTAARPVTVAIVALLSTGLLSACVDSATPSASIRPAALTVPSGEASGDAAATKAAAQAEKTRGNDKPVSMAHPARSRSQTGSATSRVQVSAQAPSGNDGSGSNTRSAGPTAAATPRPASSVRNTSPSSSDIYVGAVGDVQTIFDRTSHNIGVHRYGNFSGKVPEGRMVTVEANGQWADIARTQPGSQLYDDIVRWTQTIKSRPEHILLAYQHEPEMNSKANRGSAQDYIAAYRRVVTIFRQQGVTNVSYTWQMTDWAFRTSPSDRQYAAKWYPGDAYVDTVGADAYNWHTCGVNGQGRWVELSSLFGPAVAFAQAHGKMASLPEFASDADPQRAQWLANAHSYLVANKSVIQAVFYFNHPPTNLENSDCRWNLSTSAEYSGYGQIAGDTANFTP